MGAYPFGQAVKNPENMCEHCSNLIGPVDVFANHPDDSKCEGAGMSLKPQWGGRLDDDEDLGWESIQHAFIEMSYNIRDHTDSEKFRKFAMETKRVSIPMCELGKQLPKIHVVRQKTSQYPEIRRKMDMDGVPRMVDIDGHNHCGHCGEPQTYQGYADYSWRSSAERCTNPECIMNNKEIGEQ